jgi:hypothetical protein
LGIAEYAALSKTPHALADGLMLVFKNPAGLTSARKTLPRHAALRLS